MKHSEVPAIEAKAKEAARLLGRIQAMRSARKGVDDGSPLVVGVNMGQNTLLVPHRGGSGDYSNCATASTQLLIRALFGTIIDAEIAEFERQLEAL